MSSGPPRGRPASSAVLPVVLALVIVGVGVWVLTPGSGDARGTSQGATAEAGAGSDDGTGMPPGDGAPQIVRERSVVFVHADGDEIHILDGQDGTLLRALAPGEGGFLRGALRPLERERRRFDADPTAPYRLVLHAGGRLLLIDPHSGLELDVDAFGRSSRAEFLTLLPPA